MEVLSASLAWPQNETYIHTYIHEQTNKMNITKQTQIHRHREQTSGYQWGDARRERQDGEED